jgi:L-amino acid N-acyltransferase
MIIRQARLGDAEKICAIFNAIIRDTVITFTTKERRESEIAADVALRWTAFQVAEHDAQVVGFATFGPFRSGPGYTRTMELTIHLSPDARGHGTGRALLRRLEEVAIAQGVHVLVAGISAANPGGIAFHTACGFDEVGRMPEVGIKAGQRLDLVLMQKILPKVEDSADSGGAAG